MYEEVFEEFQLTVVELPIEFVDDLPVYRGHLKELTFLFSGSLFTKKTLPTAFTGLFVV